MPVSLPRLVTSLATAKSLEVAARLSNESVYVIGADTLVTTSDSDMGVPLGKPANKENATEMLQMLAGRTHFVYTGIAVTAYVDGAARVLGESSTRSGVTFRSLTQSMIEDYVNTGESLDKAGAYGAQGYAAPFISVFSGDFYNVVGLPLCALGELLESCGVDWWRRRTIMPAIIG
jgi:septum formation protein